MKSLSSVVAIIMVLVITIALVGILYTWITTTVGSTAKTGTQVTSKLKEDLTTCIRIDSVSGNKVYLRNCGSGKIYNQSLAVFLDGEQLPHSLPSDIDPGKTGAVRVYGLWKYSLGSHTLKVSLGQLSIQKRVDLVPNPSAVAVYTFETLTRDNVTYDSAGDNDGVLYTGGEPALSKVVPGKFGNALDFDGVDDNIRIPLSDELNETATGSQSIAAWVYLKGSGTYSGASYYAVTMQSGYNQGLEIYEFSTGKKPMFCVYNSSKIPKCAGDGGPILDLRRWYFLVGTYDEITGEIKIYIDGTLVDEDAIPGPRLVTNKDFFIGGGVGLGKYLNGTIDEVMVFDEVLGPDEVVVFSGG